VVNAHPLPHFITGVASGQRRLVRISTFTAEPSAGTTSPLRISGRQSIGSAGPLRAGLAVAPRTGKRAAAPSSRGQRGARRNFRYCPPAYISATTAAADTREGDYGNHRLHGDDIEADIASAQADDNLDQQHGQHRHGGGCQIGPPANRQTAPQAAIKNDPPPTPGGASAGCGRQRYPPV
jgi:hypothetical protein